MSDEKPEDLDKEYNIDSPMEANIPETSVEGDWSDGSEYKNACKLIEFDFCRLIEVSEKSKTQCHVCKKKRHKKVKTSFLCCNCNIPVCLKCYDHHRRERMLLAIRAFVKKNAPAKVEISKCGEFLEVIDGTEEEFKETVNKTQENNKPLKSDICTDPPILKTEEPVSCSENQEATNSTCDEKNCHSIKRAIHLLKEKYKVISEVMIDNGGNFKCIYFQDSHMKDFFNFYSHRVCIDLSFPIVDLNAAVVLFLAEDSNGQSEVISTAILLVESMENITWLITMFKKHNPNWRNIKMLVVDSSLQNREIIRNCFPDANMMICFYQAARTFYRDIYNNLEFCEISIEQKKYALELFESMALAFTEMEYSLLYQQLQSLDGSVLEYFDRVWNPLRSEWRIRIEYHESILYAINGFVIFIENKLKPVLSNSSDLCCFIDKFFFILQLLRMEKKHKMTNTVQSDSLSMYSKFTPQFHVSKILTSYAADFVNHQLDVSAEINISPGVLLDNYVFCHFGTSVVASSTNCSCKFFAQTFLPCCHIFAVRRILNISVFDETLCDARWTQKYYLTAHASLQDSDNNSGMNECVNKGSSKAGSELINKMLSEISNYESTFENKVFLLGKIVSSWQNNENICLLFEGPDEPETAKTRGLKLEPLPDQTTSLMKEEEEESEESMSCSSETHDPTVEETRPSEEFQISENNVDKTPKPDFLSIDWEFGNEIFSGKYINFLYLTCVICKTKDTCIKWLQYMGYLSAFMPCPSCGNPMQQESATRLTDGALWVCRNDKINRKNCGKRCSVRRGTWLERTNMSLEQILTFVYMWIHGFQQQQVMSELGIAYATYTVWEKYFRRICMSVVKNEMQYDYEGADEDISNSSEDRNCDNEWMVKWHETKCNKDPFLAFLTDAKNYHEINTAQSAASE